MALVDLALHVEDKPLSLANIAERQEIPLAYLEQIFARLKKAGLIASVRGPGGGYRLARDGTAISIAEVILAADESIKMTRCNGRMDGCMTHNAKCLTHELWEGLGQQIYAYLDGISLADVCEENLSDAQKKPVIGQSAPIQCAI